jgi:acylphosphatase
MSETAVQVQINGRVQGVSYRAWLEQLALTLGLSGWVRNRHDGWVEAVLKGPEGAIEAALALMERGPPGARVEDVAVRPAEAEEIALIPGGEGFAVLPEL